MLRGAAALRGVIVYSRALQSPYATAGAAASSFDWAGVGANANAAFDGTTAPLLRRRFAADAGSHHHQQQEQQQEPDDGFKTVYKVCGQIHPRTPRVPSRDGRCDALRCWRITTH